MQQSFYISNLDITKVTVLSEIAESCGVEKDAFEKMFHSRAAMVNTYQEFIAVRKLGVQGFPSLLFKLNEQFDFLARGYQPVSSLKPKIVQWLAA